MNKGLLSFCASFIITFPLIFFPACSTSHNQALRNELSGRGPLTLDLNNPYLAPNKFLSEETKTSETLKGFLSLKGAPEVIEFSEPIFGTTSLKLIYKSKNESYLLEEHRPDWIISGPYELRESDLSNEIIPIESSHNDNSLLNNNERSPSILNIEQGGTPKLPLSDDPNAKVVKNDLDEQNSVKNLNKQVNFKDIYHQANFNGQTISFLSHWYTGNIMNVDRIRRINSSLGENLKIGDIVRIPSYLTTKDEQPAKDDLKKFLVNQ